MAENPLLITDTNVTGVLKNVYAQYRVNCFPLLTPLLANIKKGQAGGPQNMRFGGNGVFWDTVLTRPVGATASQLGNLPPMASAKEVQAFLGIKRTYVRRQIDGLAIQGTESREAAFIPLARKIMQEAVDAGRLMQQEVLHGNGLGIKGVVSVVTDQQHITVISPYGVTGAGQGGLLLDVNMYVAVLNAAGNTSRGTSFISSVTNAGDTASVVFTTAMSGMVSTDIIVAATLVDNSYNQFPNGLINSVNLGNTYNPFEGIDNTVAGQTRWNSTQMTAGVDTNDVVNPSEMDIWELATRIVGRSGKNAKVNPSEFLLLTTPGIERKLAESLVGQRRIEAELEIKGGFKALKICGIPLVSDFWCPAGVIYLVHLPTLTWIDLLDWTKLQYEGSGPWRFIADQDAYEINFGAYWNFGALQRNTHGVLSGFTDTNRYSFVM